MYGSPSNASSPDPINQPDASRPQAVAPLVLPGETFASNAPPTIVRDPALDATLAESHVNGGPPPFASAGCTAPQLRRFIKSRPYVPMHELRRRFGINGSEDEVTSVELADGRVYLGLPAREGGLLGELLRGGEIGYELSLDPRTPVVVGLYPMRPVART